MSLINDMLRDLEARNKGAGKKPSAGTGPEVVERDRTLVRRLLVTLTLCLIVGGLIFMMVVAPRQQEEIALPVTESAPAGEIVDAKAMNDDSEHGGIVVARPLFPAPLEDKETATETSAPETGTLTAMAVEVEKEAVRILLDFSAPPEYRLLQDGGGPSALVIALSEIEMGDALRIPELETDLVKQISLLPRGGELQLLIDLEKWTRAQRLELVRQGEGYRLVVGIAQIPEKFKPVAASARPQVARAAPPAAPEPRKKVAAAVISESTVVVKAEKIPADIAVYRTGLELKQSDLGAAQAAFERALQLNSQLDQARLELVDLALMQADVSGAEALLVDSGRVHESILLKKSLIRLLLQQQRSAEALKLLAEGTVPSLNEDGEFHALKAAALREEGHFTAAADSYGRLLETDPQNVLWWFGLGISRDQSGDYQNASDAYSRALALPGLRQDLRNYIQDRLKVL